MDCANLLVSPDLTKDSNLQEIGWSQTLAGFIHVAMKCCFIDADRGHYINDKGKLLRSAPVVNNQHKFGGAGVQSAKWIADQLKTIAESNASSQDAAQRERNIAKLTCAWIA